MLKSTFVLFAVTVVLASAASAAQTYVCTALPAGPKANSVTIDLTINRESLSYQAGTRGPVWETKVTQVRRARCPHCFVITGTIPMTGTQINVQVSRTPLVGQTGPSAKVTTSNRYGKSKQEEMTCEFNPN